MEIRKMHRLEYFDFLKTIGFLCLILAHVQSPKSIMYIRNFDVPLMVMLSAFLAENSKKEGKIRTGEYIFKRFKRIILPPWIFFAFFFMASYAVNVQWSASMILKTFLFQRDSFGYVWIFWIYFMMACITPLIAKVDFSLRNILIIMGGYILYEYCYYKGILVYCRAVDYTFYYLIPYGAIAFLGYHYSRLSFFQKVIIQAVSSIIWVGCVILGYLYAGKIIELSLYKYPPRIYYLSYGVMVMNLLMLIFEDKDFYLFRNKIVVFISSHTMWIYLWHIPIVFVLHKMFPDMPWLLGFVIIVITASLIVAIQNFILDKIERRRILKIWSIFRG